MLRDHPDSAKLAGEVAEYFGGDQHGSHGQRIGIIEARRQHLDVVALEDDQALQEKVLTLYHLSTIAFEMGPALKTIVSSNERLWVKNMQTEVVVQQSAPE